MSLFTTPELSIIIPTKDRGDIFSLSCRRVINFSALMNVEILVINNSLTPVEIRNKPENVFIYENPRNKNSVFSSRNYGASLARSPILLFVDDDILVSKESIDYVMQFHAEHPAACLNVNWVYPPELTEKIRKTCFGRYLIKHGFTAMKTLYGEEKWHDDRPFISKSVASFFFSIRKDDFVKIGGYDENILHEGTDVDISNRLNKNNILIWINPLVTVYHNEADRSDIVNWLERKKRMGEVQHSAFSIQHSQFNYSFIKRIGFRGVYFFQPVILQMLKIFDKIRIDFMGFFLINALLGANICRGYNIKKGNER